MNRALSTSAWQCAGIITLAVLATGCGGGDEAAASLKSAPGVALAEGPATAPPSLHGYAEKVASDTEEPAKR
ncbi:MAG: hypothetical protein JWR60_2858 [Polaromonas sp.]|nr:hypothetical protein [Polaromonas sp.]